MGGLISIGAGALADRLGHRLVLVVGICGFSAGMLQFLTGVPWLLVALAVILGLAHGMRSTSGQSYLLSGIQPFNRSAWPRPPTFWAGTIGTAASSLVAGPVVEAFGFGGYALVGLGLNFVPAAITLRYLRDVRPNPPCRRVRRRLAHPRHPGAAGRVADGRDSLLSQPRSGASGAWRSRC